ncbi:MAG: prophage regulatory protein [Streptosporangiaceae bacterium]|jgi:predicted DNA-binding transcriptional regulator AlpA|nr:prophage regulatory protein [Streptosporangiaceae bacterium]
MDLSGYLTADQVAERLGINRQSVYNLTSANPDFPRPVRAGRTPLWREKDIDAWRVAHPARRKRGTLDG